MILTVFALAGRAVQTAVAKSKGPGTSTQETMPSGFFADLRPYGVAREPTAGRAVPFPADLGGQSPSIS